MAERDVGEEVLRQLRVIEDRLRRLEARVDELLPGAPAAEGLLRTGVEGLDGMLGGGIPRGSVVLLRGPPGGLKTTLALAIAAADGGTFLALEEGRESLTRIIASLGLSPPEGFIVDVARLRAENPRVEGSEQWFPALLQFLGQRRTAGRGATVVIDSVDALLALAAPREPRTALFHFLQGLRGMTITALIIRDGEVPAGDPEEALADGILQVEFRGDGEGGQLWLRCPKLRHAPHARGYFRLDLEGGRPVVKPRNRP